MTKYNTGNPVGSADPRDRHDNTKNFDELLLSKDKLSVPDRLGVPRKSWHGMESEFNADQSDRTSRFNADQVAREQQYQQVILEYGNVPLGDYAEGIRVTSYNQTIRDCAGGTCVFYRAAVGTMLPYETTGLGMPEGGAFVDVGDATLRGDLVQSVATFDNLSDMKLSSGLVAGRKARTMGYNYVGDGGGNTYNIVAANTHTPDGGRYVDLPNSDAQAVAIDNLKTQAGTAVQFGVKLEKSPFGLGGYQQVVGDKFDAHYAFGSVVEVPNSTRWLCVYRKASAHGVEDGAEMRLVESFDHGESWVNDRLLYTNPLSDARPDPLSIMSGGRIGFFVNRQNVGSTHFSPLFFYTDDGGDSFTNTEVTTVKPYTFAAVGGIIPFPSSQGGDDDAGFISYGSLDAGTGLDYLYTTNNGESWSIGLDAAFPGNNIEGISENVQVRLGDTDRWLIYARARSIGGAWHGPLAVYATTNLLDWGLPLDAGIECNGTPPGAFYDEVTDKVYVVATARAGRSIEGLSNNLLIAGDDAEALWASGGVFSKGYDVLCTTPNWTTGYVRAFRSVSGGMCMSFTAGENVGNQTAGYSSMWLIGDFPTKGIDMSKWVDAYTRDMRNVRSLHLYGEDDSITGYPIEIRGKSKDAVTKAGPYGMYWSAGTTGQKFTYSFNLGDVLYAHNKGIEFNVKETAAFKFEGATSFKGANFHYGVISSNIGGLSSMIHLPVQGSSFAACRTEVAIGSSRKHFTFHNDAGEVGSISTSGMSTAFTTTSDETLKDFTGELAAEDAIAIIKADPVREFKWLSSGEKAVGWGAQTSYAISKDLASPGGWFLEDDTEVESGIEGATYVPWGVDQSRRTPYLWAAVSALLDRVEALELELSSGLQS